VSAKVSLDDQRSRALLTPIPNDHRRPSTRLGLVYLKLRDRGTDSSLQGEPADNDERYWGGGGGGGDDDLSQPAVAGGGSGFGPTGTSFNTGVQSGNGQVTVTHTLPPDTPNTVVTCRRTPMP
jgi:hypothetical protein